VQYLQKFGDVTRFFADAPSWRQIGEDLATVEALRQKAATSLNQRQTEPAETALIQAESQVTQTEKAVHDLLRLSLRDELRARLSRATDELDTLKGQCDRSGLSIATLNQLSAWIDDLLRDLDQMQFDESSFAEQVRPFIGISLEISETRAALRFRTDVVASLESIKVEVQQALGLIELANTLGLPVEEAQEKRRSVSTALERVNTVTFSRQRSSLGDIRPPSRIFTPSDLRWPGLGHQSVEGGSATACCATSWSMPREYVGPRKQHSGVLVGLSRDRASRGKRGVGEQLARSAK
jgi:hypothetical protein